MNQTIIVDKSKLQIINSCNEINNEINHVIKEIYSDYQFSENIEI
jgi:hypothetical protein